MGFVNMEIIQMGQQYTTDELAQLWGYKSRDVLRRGVFTPANQNIIVLFVTKIKQKGTRQYHDDINGNLLYMSGQKEHGTDKRLYQNYGQKIDDIYLFYSEKHHTPYTYMGSCLLTEAHLHSDTESEFVFLINTHENGFDDEDSLVDYLLNSKASPETMNNILEGSSKLTWHIRYERNPINRKKAIQAQGSKCVICGFDYNNVYGKDLADGYIEVHHIVPLAEGPQIVDPAKDLIPVCANCHRMLHRKKKNNISVDELKHKLNQTQDAI